MLTYQTTTSILAVIFVALIFWLIRKDHLRPRKALSWVIFSLTIGLLGIFPKIVDWIAGFLGIAYTPTIILTVGILVILLKLLRLDIDHSKSEQKISVTMQRLVVLEKRFERQFDTKENE